MTLTIFRSDFMNPLFTRRILSNMYVKLRNSFQLNNIIMYFWEIFLEIAG
jgi:hypothetical protein